MRMRAHPLAEMRGCADLMLVELRKLIPAFLTRVDVADRGGAWIEYWRTPAQRVADVVRPSLADVEPEPSPEVTLVEWDPDGEVKIVAAVLYEASGLPDDQLLDVARAMTPTQREDLLRASSARAATGATSPGGRSSAPATGSTCCATTAPSATCSGTACSRSSGSASPPTTGSNCARRSTRSALRRTGER